VVRSDAAVGGDAESVNDAERAQLVHELRLHPKLSKIFGVWSPKDYERVKRSILEHGVVEPIELTPNDAEEYPSTVADGYLRLAIADELGIERVPVRVIDHLRSYADQAIYALAKTQRKELTEEQRAAQEQEVAKIVQNASTDWKRARGYRGWRTTEIVAALVNAPERTLRRRQKAFNSETSTKALRRAVNERVLSVSAASEVVVEAERRFEPGSEAARNAVNEAVAELRRSGRRRRRRGGPLPSPDMPPLSSSKRDTFLDADLEARLAAWAMSKAREHKKPSLAAMLEPMIVRDFIIDVRVAAAEMRRRLRRLAGPKLLELPSPDVYRELNQLLQGRFGVATVRRGQPVDIAALQRSYRKLARAVHPDLNQHDGEATKRAQELNADYERAMELIGAVNPNQED
jgi:hypothetical protein